jgi:hypothetical protein
MSFSAASSSRAEGIAKSTFGTAESRVLPASGAAPLKRLPTTTQALFSRLDLASCVSTIDISFIICLADTEMIVDCARSSVG